MHSSNKTYISKKIPFNKGTFYFVLGILFIATILRTPLTVVGPIISFIQEGLNISYVLAGFLTTIPLLAFAIVSPITPKVARALGMEKTLFLSVVVLAVGVVLRSIGFTPTLLVGTVLIGVAIAFGNVLIPGYFKMKFPLHIGLLMGIYTVSMNLSAGLGAGVSHSIASSPVGWQGALGFSVVLALLTLVIWVPIVRGSKVEMLAPTTDAPKKVLWKTPLAWAVAFTMGFQSFIFYCTSAWMPEIFVSQGMSEELAGWMMTINQMAQLPMTFIIPIVAGKLTTQRPIVVFFTICYLISFVGIYFEWTSLAALWMIFLGFAGGASFGLCMMLFTLRTQTAHEAADLSGFAQSVGYTIAATGPVLFGLLHELFGNWNMSIVLFIVVSVILSTTAFISAQKRFI